MTRSLRSFRILLLTCLSLVLYIVASEPADAAIPLDPNRFLTSPGHQVGTTHYDYQTSGPTGNRIVKDSFGGIHVCWMNGIDFWSGNRWIYYNFREETGDWRWDSIGTQVNTNQGAGYTNMDVLSDGVAAITYHDLHWPGPDYTVVAVDISPGFGAFTEYDVPDSIPEDRALWPYVAVDRQDRIHVTAHGHWTYQLMYTRSEDEGRSWIDPELIDTLYTECGIVVTSSVDDKAAVVYVHHTVDPEVYGDVYYVESPDGITWDWTNKVNVTNHYTNPGVDSTVAYFDIDAIYDNDGDLHIVWVGTHWSWTRGWLIHSYLMHWSEATGISEVAEHPQWEFPNCHPGSWNLSFAKLSIGCDSNNNLFVIATRFDNQDCSVGGYANGEIYGVASSDGGTTWGEPVNLTSSPSPGCLPGECDSDHWSSLAETVDDSLYILYINDKDAGGIPLTEGTDTENPVMYYAVHKSVLLPTVLDDAEEAKPRRFALEQNHPNPFNATTEISYQLPRPAHVTLEVFNLLGQKIKTLVDEHQTSGEKSVVWDASAVSSGIYFCKLTAGEVSQVRRMTLLR